MLVKTAVSVLNQIGPKTTPAAKAAIIALYDVEVVLLQKTGFLTSAQAATLIADAKTL